ncbi:hypothetical protein IHE45_08G064700 [Dioscorea alata]|uniref:Uncharacterized protein n=1 Tax=Dioscorea alata TaxID=55571 RepID=A0ACB7VJX6_DIOAL|nr:hypothetical protein IHE45_08G064700 [Dioscorea alata]
MVNFREFQNARYVLDRMIMACNMKGSGIFIWSGSSSENWMHLKKKDRSSRTNVG